MATKNKKDIWNRDGDHSFLYIYDIDSCKSILLMEFDKVIEAPNYSSDGKYLTYNSEGRIYKFDLETKNSTLIESYYVNQCNNDHVLLPDGSGIAVSHGTAEDGQSRIYIVPFNKDIPRLVTPMGPSYLHGISPDGQTLAYCAERNGEYDVYTIPTMGGIEKRLTSTPGLNDGPEYNSTGEYIWFNSVRNGLMQAFKMKSDGSMQTQMTFCEGINTWFPHISPDNSKVVMLAYSEDDVAPDEHVPNKNVQIRMMNSDGSDLKTIIELFGGQGTINVNSWSPDSKKFAYVSYTHNS